MTKKEKNKIPRYCMIWHGAKAELKLSLQQYLIAYIIWRLCKEGTRKIVFKREYIAEQLGISIEQVRVVLSVLRKKLIIAGDNIDTGSGSEDEKPGLITTDKWNRIISKYEYDYEGSTESLDLRYTKYWNGLDKDLDLSLLDYVICHGVYFYGHYKENGWTKINQTKMAKDLNILPSNLSRQIADLFERKELERDDERHLIRVARSFQNGYDKKELEYVQTSKGAVNK